ncbi:hypothetical protein M3612_20040 [Niallia taxi]|uniref:hypothetical protein n=1 Tax=Niallia taxi TaxID=2499688 RepID=UPI0020407B46|nr:hypothetical protein [Niallia taxi]MCM3216780.1 hypothetical protein [Niallia taxi]
MEVALKGIRFTKQKNGLEWRMYGSVFRIEPFQNQSRELLKGYRVYFDGDIIGGSNLCIGAQVTNIVCILDYPSKTSQDWINELTSRPSCKMIDPRGLFVAGDICLTIVKDSLIIQKRSRKNQKLKLIENLKQIDFIREDLSPKEFDLFSRGSYRMSITFFTPKKHVPNRTVLYIHRWASNSFRQNDHHKYTSRRKCLNRNRIWELLTHLHTDQVRIVNPRDERYKGRATERKHYIVSFFVQFANQKLIKEIEVLAMEENHARNLVQERFKGLGISVNIAKLRSIIN